MMQIFPLFFLTVSDLLVKFAEKNRPMTNWYAKYMTIYGKTFSEVPQHVIDETKARLARIQSPEPLASIVVIAYNEEKHLQACLWAISEIQCKYPVEIIGVDNDSKDRTAEIYEKSGIPYYTEYEHSCGYARRCGLQHAKGKYYFDVDSDTLYPPHYFEVMLEYLMKPGVSCASATWSFFPDDKSLPIMLNMDARSPIALISSEERMARWH